MKLYTEEQVNKIALQVKDNGYWNHLEILPIELPSDDEIEKNGYQDKEFNDIWEEGAKWVIGQIKQQSDDK